MAIRAAGRERPRQVGNTVNAASSQSAKWTPAIPKGSVSGAESLGVACSVGVETNQCLTDYR
ncbi:hypothetical protein, partial [Enterobacter cloacae]|uniref:hypothetical protein n=1 Tax=Enterobacter cloacae TaxID=550 RepID=UPI001954B768